jgi:hypothetical protein
VGRANLAPTAPEGAGSPFTAEVAANSGRSITLRGSTSGRCTTGAEKDARFCRDPSVT